MNIYYFQIIKATITKCKDRFFISKDICLKYFWASAHPWFHFWTLLHFLATPSQTRDAVGEGDMGGSA